MGGVVNCEVYPNAPLVMVAAEVRHPELAAQHSPTDVQRLKQSLRDVLPLHKPATRVLSVVGTGDAAGPVVRVPRFVNRSQTTSVTFNLDSIVLETTDYQGFEAFSSLFDRVVDCALEVSTPDGVDRVGLRYVDEIRVPNPEGGIDWEEWIHRSLLGPSAEAVSIGLLPGAFQSTATYGGALEGVDEPHVVVLRYGSGNGYAVEPGGDLRRSTPTPGPFFLMDIDSYWSAHGPVPDLEPNSVRNTLRELHVPVRRLFESLITNKLREEVLRRNDV